MKKKKIIILTVILIIAAIIVGIVVSNRKKYGIIEIERAVATFTDASLEYIIEDENIVKFNHMDTKSNRSKDELGGEYQEIYYFEGLKEGETNIMFIIRDGAGNVSEKYEYNMVVDKNLNVKVISNND